MSLPESMNQRVSVTEWTLLGTNSGKSEITAKLSFYSAPQQSSEHQQSAPHGSVHAGG